MANTKSMHTRLLEIDKCLRQDRGCSIKEMMERCNERLEFEGYDRITSPVTIHTDLDYIGSHYDTIIKSEKTGRNVRYFYEDSKFSIGNGPLRDVDIQHLEEIMSSLSMYEGRPQMDVLGELKDRLQLTLDSVKKPSEPIVGYDDNIYLKGRDHFKTLLDYINKGKALKITYRKFDTSEAQVLTVHPYYLKQYNKRWFLISQRDDRDDIAVYPFDRIEDIQESPLPYKPNNGRFDFKEYYEDVVGVSRSANDEPIDILLRVTKSQYNYISTKPIHDSQKIVERGESDVTIKLNLVPNFELEQLLLSYGEGVTVIAPESLRNRMRERIQASLEKYM